MMIYRTKSEKFQGSSFHEICKKAFAFHMEIKKKTKRRSYIRSKYFKKQKIFLDIFWHHLHEKKNHRDKIRRVKYFRCGLEVLQNTSYEPIKIYNPNNKSELFYRFMGMTPHGKKFVVQVKETISTSEKFLISIFPIE